ncbi:MAG: hypothetical protein C0617_05050 [Desulfuromonas sp.]|uniref:hypothetical protein n=1 Tax=Desulfuromonas sp. TaxID=892 RepID=UPI000CC4F284|nr:hypothetical protein [Desulfuromonas sp.]PLX85061.1 MAG: hypothetical protein C0617_05050 [Desulfuromonas sp.]
MKRQIMGSLPFLLVGLMVLGGCASSVNPSLDPWGTMRQVDGSVVWQEEYAFEPPPLPWRILDLDETDISLAFFRGCKGDDPGSYPCESTFAYAEEPFGYSKELIQRQEEFFKRFLWAARVDFKPPQLRPLQILGEEGLEVVTEGIEPVLRHKVYCKVLLARRGERVVAFHFTQWRAADEAYDLALVEDFDRFVDSFRFQKISFYELL